MYKYGISISGRKVSIFFLIMQEKNKVSVAQYKAWLKRAIDYENKIDEIEDAINNETNNKELARLNKKIERFNAKLYKIDEKITEYENTME